MSAGLGDIDANLLPALHALLEERNLTRAGKRVGLGQPAMSAALGRLRAHYGDALLVRSGRDVVLTEVATRLRPVAAAAVAAVESLVGASRAFDPESSAKQFTLSMTAYAMTVLATPVVRAIEAAAPHCSVVIDALPLRADALNAHLARHDLIVGPLGFGLPGQSQSVFTDRLVPIAAHDNPHLDHGCLTIATLAAMGHAVADIPTARSPGSPFDVVLAETGLADRTIAVTVESLLTLPFAIRGTHLVAFVPLRLARRCVAALDLVIARTDLPDVGFVEGAHWHPRRDQDPAVLWLRRLLHDIAVELDDEAE